MNKFGIVIATFNRPESLKRLLNSIFSAEYFGDSVDLIISIDYEESEDHKKVCELANEIQWKYGKKIVNIEQKNLGLKKHILQCGEYTREYDAIIMLEDDLLVSKCFYGYTKQAFQYYYNCDEVAGISLYNQTINQECTRLFTPLNTECDNYFMQYAPSWGQVWYKREWDLFINWYNSYEGIFDSDKIPSTVIAWSEKSWLKWHIKYLIENNKYFVYPYVSLSTNFSEAGTHNKIQNNDYQVPLQFQNKNYLFNTLSDSLAVYDAFFENQSISKLINFSGNVELDLYGQKKSYSAEYIITSKEFINVKPEKCYGLQLRPQEANLIYNIDGQHFFLYEVSKLTDAIRKKNKKNKNHEMLYDFKSNNFWKSLKSMSYFFKKRIKTLVKR